MTLKPKQQKQADSDLKTIVEHRNPAHTTSTGPVGVCVGGQLWPWCTAGLLRRKEWSQNPVFANPRQSTKTITELDTKSPGSLCNCNTVLENKRGQLSQTASSSWAPAQPNFAIYAWWSVFYTVQNQEISSPYTCSTATAFPSTVTIKPQGKLQVQFQSSGRGLLQGHGSSCTLIPKVSHAIFLNIKHKTKNSRWYVWMLGTVQKAFGLRHLISSPVSLR